ncbi:hypothetical protein [Kutzneria buriramensis]|uniref:hypothetical protein n=1 Tax=Kutzneria buriramensis TaxID=1045776 RepID=UPI0011C0D09F|nr:hypothetical protein [Kutzneria buriramensis]
MRNTGVPAPGLWLMGVRLAEMSGLTVLEVAEDESLRVLGPEGGMYLFPTRHGMADFLASGEPHSLDDGMDGVDVTSVEPGYLADFDLLGDPDVDEDDAARIWTECLLVVEACGIEDPQSFEDALARVTALTTCRDDFEQPGYEERDYWMGRDIQPVRLTLPSGSGVTLVAMDDLRARDTSAHPFLGGYGQVVLFRDPAALLAHIRADGTEEIRESMWWPGDAPHCEPVLSVDVRTVDARDRTSDAFDFLCGLARVLTNRYRDLRPGKTNSDRQIRQETERIERLLREVNGKVTWR